MLHILRVLLSVLLLFFFSEHAFGRMHYGLVVLTVYEG